MLRSRSRVEVCQKLLVNAACCAMLALVIVMITGLYISSERNFHWWIDWYYPTIRIATTFRESPTEALKLVQQTLVEDRNRLYGLPLVPLILIFGTSRLVYEVGLALVYLLPLALVMGAVASQLIQVHRFTVFWLTALVTLLMPVNWMPTFMGIPDTGGTVFVGLATLVYLQDLRRQRWWRVPLMGVFLGVAILLRRHFMYGAIAFFGAATLQSLMVFAVAVGKKRQIPWQNLLSQGVRISLVAVTSLTTIALVAPEFTYRAITTRYGTFYSSWSLPFGDILGLYAYYYGWATWLIVAIGFSASLLTRTVALPGCHFIGLSGILSLIIWLGVLRYGNIFYALHITPLVVIGLVAFIWTTWIRLKGKVRYLMLGVVGIYLVSNFILGLTPLGKFESFARPLFALSNPPLVSTDYDQVVRLVDYLRQLAPHEEPIFVAGYQRLQLDSSLLNVAELIAHGRDDRILNILQVPKVNSRDEYPLETLLQAKYVVVPNYLAQYPGIPTKVPPVGEWLPNQEVGVVQVVVDAFTQNWEFANDFQRLPLQFTLSGNTKVSVYKRNRPTSLETAVRTLHAMQQQIGKRPGSQLDWIVLSQPLNNSFASKNLDNTNRLVAYGSDRVSINVSQTRSSLSGSSSLRLPRLIWRKGDRTPQIGTSFLYLGPLPEKAEVTGAITYLDNSCVTSSLRLAMLNSAGQIVSSTGSKYSPRDDSNFRLSISGKNPAYLLLDTINFDRNNLINSCTVELNSLAISDQESGVSSQNSESNRE